MWYIWIFYLHVSVFNIYFPKFDKNKPSVSPTWNNKVLSGTNCHFYFILTSLLGDLRWFMILWMNAQVNQIKVTLKKHIKKLNLAPEHGVLSAPTLHQSLWQQDFFFPSLSSLGAGASRCLRRSVARLSSENKRRPHILAFKLSVSKVLLFIEAEQSRLTCADALDRRSTLSLFWTIRGRVDI